MFTSKFRSQVVPSKPSSTEDSANSNSEQLLIKIPGAIVHLIESERSVQLASGDLSIVSLKQGDTPVAILARVGDNGIRWPLAKDAASVKLDESHYFFTLRLPLTEDEIEVELLNYGVTIASKGQEVLLKELDKILETYSCFTVQEVKDEGNWVMVEGNVAKEISPEELMTEEKKKELMEESSAAYWTVLAPNVEDYSGSVARMIAAGSVRLIKGILWCGDVTVDRLKKGNQLLSKRLGSKDQSNVQISPATMERIKRVNMLTKKSEEMANATLSGVLKVSGSVTSSIVNSYVGKKFFSILPGQIILASLDGFNKVCDAVEYAGRSVMSTSTVVTTDLVSKRFGEEAGKLTNQGLDAAGHAVGIAWAVFKIRKAINPKSSLKPTNLLKAAAVANSTGIKAK
ncbi:protein EARLY-RESPONSIVE TO DEHYDRATION 7, chloroplastic-like [Euphorbia lathyris]|uniref:protein EARLY-RESPONSIVE TO DEHYDRATION 7, chloroplastic-like n=1 Tax=Euphorbia lathyris TaxID=212925 RepID=UPI00331438B2